MRNSSSENCVLHNNPRFGRFVLPLAVPRQKRVGGVTRIQWPLWWKWWNVALFSNTPWKTTRGKRSFTLAMFCWMSALFGFDSPRCFEPTAFFLNVFWQLQNLTLPRNNLQRQNSRFRLPVTVFHHIPSIFHHSVSFPLIHFRLPFAHRDMVPPPRFASHASLRGVVTHEQLQIRLGILVQHLWAHNEAKRMVIVCHCR